MRITFQDMRTTPLLRDKATLVSEWYRNGAEARLPPALGRLGCLYGHSLVNSTPLRLSPTEGAKKGRFRQRRRICCYGDSLPPGLVAAVRW